MAYLKKKQKYCKQNDTIKSSWMAAAANADV